MIGALHRLRGAVLLGVPMLLLGAAAALGAPTEDVPAAQRDPKCGVFFEPRQARVAEEATMQVYLGLAHEMAAGQDCIQTNRTEIACQHFSRAMKALDGASPEISAHVAPGVQARMRKLNCPQ